MYKIYRAETVDSAIKKGLDELQVSEADIKIDVEERGSKGFLGMGKKESVVRLTIINPELKSYDSIEDFISRNDSGEVRDTEQEIETETENTFKTETVTDNIIEETVQTDEEILEKEASSLSGTPEVPAVESKDDEALEKKDKISIQEAALKTSEYVQAVIRDMKIENTVHVNVKGSEVWFEIETPLAAKIIGKRGQTLNALQEITQHYFNGIYKSYGSVVLDVEHYRRKRKETLEQLAVNMSKKALRTNEAVKMEPMPSFERKIMHNVLSNLENIRTHSEGKDPHRYIVIEKR